MLPKRVSDASMAISETHTRADDPENRAIARAIGEELRRTREFKGWSRAHLVSQLPSGIGDRTLLSYEHGTRHLTVLRFVEVCRALSVEPPVVLGQALQRARIHLDNLTMRIDIQRLLAHNDHNFIRIKMWAHNSLADRDEAVVELTPSAVTALATFMGCTNEELSEFLTQFTPDASNAKDVDSHALAAADASRTMI